MERCPSGLRCTLGKRVWMKIHRGFKSLPLRIELLKMKFIFIYILSFQFLFSVNQLKIGTIYTTDGHVQIISSDKDEMNGMIMMPITIPAHRALSVTIFKPIDSPVILINGPTVNAAKKP